MANKSLQQLYADFSAATRAMEVFKGRLPAVIGNECVRIAKQNFDLQGYDDGNGVTPWPERSPATNAAYDRNRTSAYRTPTGRKSTAINKYKGSVFGSHNPLLEQTRNMYRNLQFWTTGRRVLIGWDLNIVPYAEKMNQGGPGTWGKNKTFTPARQVIPHPGEPANKKMLDAVAKKINYEQGKILKDFKK